MQTYYINPPTTMKLMMVVKEYITNKRIKIKYKPISLSSKYCHLSIDKL